MIVENTQVSGRVCISIDGSNDRGMQGQNESINSM